MGLGNRVEAVVSLKESNGGLRDISVSGKGEGKESKEEKIVIGIIFNPSESSRLVDRGPSQTPTAPSQTNSEEIESEAIRRFKYLWGSKAELRRFKDGVIQHSVVWDLPSADGDKGGLESVIAREKIPGRIIRYLLGLHFGIGVGVGGKSGKESVGEMKEVLGKLDDVLCFDKNGSRDLHLSPSSNALTNPYLATLAAFESLSKLLKNLSSSSSSDIPLTIASIRPASSYLRYTSVFPAFPASSEDGYETWSSSVPSQSRYTPLIPIVLQFESSTSWPDDLAAVQNIKLALLEALSRALIASPSFGGIARVVVGSIDELPELGEWKGSDKARIEIISREGYAFEGRILYTREPTLLRRVINPPETGPHEYRYTTHAERETSRSDISSPSFPSLSPFSSTSYGHSNTPSSVPSSNPYHPTRQTVHE